MKYAFTILLTALLLLTARAQESDTLSKLQSDIFALEEIISQLVGQQEELQYQLQQLQNNQSGESQTGSATVNPDIANQLQDIVQRLEQLEQSKAEIVAEPSAPEVAVEDPAPVEAEVAEVVAPAGDLSEEDIKNIYEASFLKLTRKEYDEAEQGFKNFLQAHSGHRLAANASYWLAETYYVRKDYKAAATQFLQAYNNYPESSKRFDALLKLSLSLRELKAPADACKSLAELLNPANDPVGLLSASTRRRAEKEQEELRCGTN